MIGHTRPAAGRVRRLTGDVRQRAGRLRRSLRQPAVARFALLVALVGVLVLVAFLVPLPEVAELRAAVDRLGPAAPVAAILAGALLLVALVPRTFVTLAWGAVFGPLAGAGYSLAATALAAAAGFAIGRLLGREFVNERVRGRLARLDHWFTRQHVFGVISVRLLPFAGFGLVSFGYGTTGARFGPYLAGTLLAAVPSALGYSAVGAAVVSPGDLHWLSVTPAVLGLAATALLLVRGFQAERRYRATRIPRQAAR